MDVINNLRGSSTLARIGTTAACALLLTACGGGGSSGGSGSNGGTSPVTVIERATRAATLQQPEDVLQRALIASRMGDYVNRIAGERVFFPESALMGFEAAGYLETGELNSLWFAGVGETQDCGADGSYELTLKGATATENYNRFQLVHSDCTHISGDFTSVLKAYSIYGVHPGDSFDLVEKKPSASAFYLGHEYQYTGEETEDFEFDYRQLALLEGSGDWSTTMELDGRVYKHELERDGSEQREEVKNYLGNEAANFQISRQEDLTTVSVLSTSSGRIERAGDIGQLDAQGNRTNVVRCEAEGGFDFTVNDTVVRDKSIPSYPIAGDLTIAAGSVTAQVVFSASGETDVTLDGETTTFSPSEVSAVSLALGDAACAY